MAPSSSSTPGGGDDGDGVLSRVTRSVSRSSIVARGRAAAAEASAVARKLLRCTGKAAWIAGTTFLVLVVPFVIEMDREQQLNDLEMQQSALLGAPSPPLPSYASAAPAK